MKFCLFVASLYPHIFTTFGRLISIFIKMFTSAYRFTISSVEFHVVKE